MDQQVARDVQAVAQTTKIVMIPSVSGGIGHISRTATLARALRRLDPTVEVEYVLDAERLRPFNIEATMQMGYRPRLMPARSRESRDGIVRACLGGASVIVDDTMRFLVPLRHVVPEAAWVTIPMHPLGDELFMDWPFMMQMDAIIWAYAPLVGLPPELEIVRDKVVLTGPFLETEDVPGKAEARALLGIAPGEQAVLYAPRGFPFGREFGHRVLGAIYGAVERLRQGAHPGLRLMLIAVKDAAELQGVPGMPAALPDWVQVRGVLPQAEALLAIRGASIVVAEGTSTMHEAAALRTPMVLTPGPIQETVLLAQKLAEQDAGRAIMPEKVSMDTLTGAFDAVLLRPAGAEAMAERAYALVTGGGGVEAAARLVLDLAARHRAARSV